MEADEALPRRTRRQEIAELLASRAWGFEELRAALGVSVHTLEDDLRHLERSLHRGEQRLAVTACRCRDCDFEFRGRAPERFRTPGRCPRCRSEYIRDARLESDRPVRRPSRNDAAVFGRYALMQLPTGFVITVVLVLLVHYDHLTATVAGLLFGVWVAVEIALFPALRVGYEVGRVHTGAEALVGAVGIAQSDLDPGGSVRLGAERWYAVVHGGGACVPAGARVRVREVRQLTLVVEPVDSEADALSGRRNG